MWIWVFGVTVALAMILGGGAKVSAELYLWTDEQGVVHMTNQWASVPESARPRVSVRESAPLPSEDTLAVQPSAPSVEPLPVTQPPLPLPPDQAQIPPPAAPSPSVVPYPRESSVLIPRSGPLVQHPKKVAPFPYNVRLDPHDPNFVWVGRNRVPKDTFTYPRVSLDTQAQFRNRVRTLEQRRSAPYKTYPTPPARP